MSDDNQKSHEEEYAQTWGTPIGQDCISLNVSLAEWLGPRLVFLAEHTTSLAPGFYASDEEHDAATDTFLGEMRAHGETLIRYGNEERDDRAAEEAFRWVAENFIHLWD